jgi:hypothetical protein
MVKLIPVAEAVIQQERLSHVIEKTYEVLIKGKSAGYLWATKVDSQKRWAYSLNLTDAWRNGLNFQKDTDKETALNQLLLIRGV